MQLIHNNTVKIDLNIFEKKEVDRIIKADKTKYILLTGWELFLMGCVVYIQYFLRYKETAYSITETFLLGTLPSLFGAAAFVSVLFIYHKIYTTLSGRYKIRHHTTLIKHNKTLIYNILNQ